MQHLGTSSCFFALHTSDLSPEHDALKFGCRGEVKEQNSQRDLEHIQLGHSLLDPLSRADATFETISSPVPVEESSNHK